MFVFLPSTQKNGAADCVPPRATFSLGPFPNIIFSPPPKCPSIFVNQNIFTQSPPPLQRIWEADWQFQQQNHSSEEEMDTANLRAPCRCHGNISTRGWRAERGWRGDGGREIWSNVNTPFWFERLIYNSQFVITRLSHFYLLSRRTHANARVLKRCMQTQRHTLCTLTNSICASLITLPHGCNSI